MSSNDGSAPATDSQWLLDGPRGRGLLLGLIEAQEVRELVHRADAAARPPGSGFSFGWFDSPQRARGWNRIRAVRARRAAREFARTMRRPVSPAELAEAVAEHRPALAPSPAELAAAFARTVDSAKYWQQPDGIEAVAAHPLVVDALRPLADAVARATRWDAPVAPRQWLVELVGRPLAPPRAPSEVLASDAAGHDSWWSAPPHDLPRTTGALPGLPEIAAGLLLVEDSFGATEADVAPASPPSQRVFEIVRAADFGRLTREFARPAGDSTREHWRVITGRDGDWIIPDWRAVAERWDGVHLTLGAYLEGATRALDCGDGVATVLAGWSPDVTFWCVPAPASGPAVRWRHTDPLGWRAAP